MSGRYGRPVLACVTVACPAIARMLRTPNPTVWTRRTQSMPADAPFGHALRLRGRCGRRIGALLREMQRGRWEGEGGGRGGKGARVILEENVVSRNLPKRGALA